MDNENLQLMIVLLLAQNPAMIEQLRPALDFWKEHGESVTALLGHLSKGKQEAPMPELKEVTTEKTEKRPPLEEIAGNDISKLIFDYLEKQNE